MSSPSKVPQLSRAELQDQLLRTQKALLDINKQVQDLQAGMSERDKMIKEFLDKVEAASKAGPAANPTQQVEGPGSWLSFIDQLAGPGGIAGALRGGGATADTTSGLESAMLDEMRRGYITWLRTGIRAMNKSAGIPDHVTLEGAQ